MKELLQKVATPFSAVVSRVYGNDDIQCGELVVPATNHIFCIRRVRDTKGEFVQTYWADLVYVIGTGEEVIREGIGALKKEAWEPRYAVWRLQSALVNAINSFEVDLADAQRRFVARVEEFHAGVQHVALVNSALGDLLDDMRPLDGAHDYTAYDDGTFRVQGNCNGVSLGVTATRFTADQIRRIYQITREGLD